MKRLNLFYPMILAALCLLASCSAPEPEKKQTAAPAEAFFSTRMGHQAFRISKQAMADSAHLQAFLDRFYGKPAVFDTTYQMEVTGDSIPESIHLFTKPINGRYASVALIYTGNTRIWADTLMADDTAGRLFFGTDSVYEKMKPYSTFFMVFHRELPLADYMVKDVNMDETRNFFFNLLDDKNDTVYWKEKLKTFSGKLIVNLTIMDGDVYIWDEPHKKFILFYAP